MFIDLTNPGHYSNLLTHWYCGDPAVEPIVELAKLTLVTTKEIRLARIRPARLVSSSLRWVKACSGSARSDDDIASPDLVQDPQKAVMNTMFTCPT